MEKLKFFVTLILFSLLITKSWEADVEITYPLNNKLVAAGDIDIKYKIDSSIKISNIRLYANDKQLGETKELVYTYYTTEVKIHEIKVEVLVDGEDPIIATTKFGVTKKGLGINEEMGKNLDLSEFNVAWYFNWGNKPSSGSQYNGVEYVPMIWTEKDKKSGENKINDLISKGYKYVFLFNEPDRSDQANMSVKDVYTVFKGAFQNKKIQISAPMTSIWPDASDWFKEWTKTASDVKYDFIVLHVYPDNFSGKAMAEWFATDIIDKTYEAFKKPIWINEFSTTGEIVNEESTIEFYKTFIPLCNERPYVVRYSPFGFRGKPWSLWNYDTGKLTSVGKAFAETGNPQ